MSWGAVLLIHTRLVNDWIGAWAVYSDECWNFQKVDMLDDIYFVIYEA